MSLSVELGLLLAVATALTSIVSFLYKHRGAVQAPEVDFRRPVHSSLVLFRSGWYTLGIAIAMASWGFHAAALSLAPISLVQSVIAGGLVMLTVIADKVFGLSVSRREWVGVGLAAAGLAFLAATLEGAGDSAHADYTPLTIAVYITGVAGAGLAVAAMARGSRTHMGVLFGASAGLLWGASDVAIKGSSASLDQGPVILVHPLALVILLASLVGLLVSAKSLQLGEAVPVIAVTSVAANVVTITAGPVVFGDPMPSDTVGLIARLLAFALVVSAAALTPVPARAAGIEEDPAPHSTPEVAPASVP
jgi:multidrug transporter EmrE-like cation transporter